MVIDTSAMVAILLREADAARFDAALAEPDEHLMSAVTWVELAIVIESRKGARGRADLKHLMQDAEISIVAVTPDQAEMAIAGFRRFGKGRHPAALNLGDCFAYALSKASDQPLLFKGGDFAQTDIVPVRVR